MDEEHSPDTPPAVIPSPDDEEEEEEAEHQPTQQQVTPPPPTGIPPEQATATPPRSEMLNLPRDFLSLRPQEPTPPPLPAAVQVTCEQPRAVSKLETPPGGNVTTTTPRQSSSTTPPAGPAAVYPRALASHEEVLRDKDLFLDTLRRLHGSLGNKSLTIPTIGGTQLDLHLLYKEVTARGGLQQVIKDRIWKEIKAVFHFPPTTTNASFVLRKYYSSLLHHYEQVYFFRNQGAVVSVPGDNPTPAPSELFSDDSDVMKRRRKRTYESSEPPDFGVSAANSIGQTVSGSIVGKFEHGYLVSVTIGNEVLKGVLYNVPPGEYVPQFATTTPLLLSNGTPHDTAGGTNNAAAVAEGELRHKRRRRLGLRKKDPNAPKLNRSAYNFFFAEQRARIRLLQPNREISRMIGDSWSKLTDEQRLPYKERGQVDKERYRMEIKRYREMLNSQRGQATESDLHTVAEAEEADDVTDDQEHELEQEQEEPEHEHEENNVHNNNNNNGDGFQHKETLEFKSILSA